MSSLWIFGSPVKDFILVYFFSFFALLLSQSLGSDLYFLLFIPFIFDQGHVYTTIIRTYFSKTERSRSKLYWLSPLILFGLTFLGLYFNFSYFWPLIIYFTYYHHLRQYYGLTKWYQFLEKSPKNIVYEKYIYLLTLMPFIGFHFRHFEYEGLYRANEILFSPNAKFFQLSLWLNILAIFIFIVHSIAAFRRKTLKLPRFMSILVPGLIHFYCFFFALNLTQVFFPIFALHGWAYINLISLSQQRIKTATDKISTYQWNLFMVCLIAIIGASAEYIFREYFSFQIEEYNYAYNILNSSLLALVLNPTLNHFVIDAYIWRRQHPDFKMTLNPS